MSEEKKTNNSSVIRVIKNKNYTVMSNKHLFCRELSLKAKGLMSLCIALPDYWEYSVAGLMSLSNDGRDSVTSAIKALEKLGFINKGVQRVNFEIIKPTRKRVESSVLSYKPQTLILTVLPVK